MFIFFFFYFLEVFIVGDLSDVSGANWSISGFGSCRSVLGEHIISHDTRKLCSVSIGKVDWALQVRMPRLEVRMPRLEVWIVMRLVGMILHKNTFPTIMNSGSLNWDSWVRGFAYRRVRDDGGFSRGVSRTRSFLLRDRKGMSCDTSGWGCRPLVSLQRSEGVVLKVLRRAHDVTEDDTNTSL